MKHPLAWLLVRSDLKSCMCFMYCGFSQTLLSYSNSELAPGLSCFCFPSIRLYLLCFAGRVRWPSWLLTATLPDHAAGACSPVGWRDGMNGLAGCLLLGLKADYSVFGHKLG